MAERLKVKLEDGSYLDIDPNEWPGVASGTWTTSHLGGDYGLCQSLDWTMYLGQHQDGRKLVYAVMDDGEHPRIIRGELFLAPTVDDAECVKRVGESLGLPFFVVDSCLNRMDLRCGVAV